ncbi:MAG: membrane-associated phospholipid phosphatase [Herminiimonas sp.]|nr:membrane-associated phospholipid phosphatase [Herminiimonas sp.]
MISWNAITFIGDSVVLLPAAALLLAWMLVGRSWRMAFWWSLLCGLGLFLVAATKIAFIGWGLGLGRFDYTGLSGHAMRAAAILPVLGWAVSSGGPSRPEGRLGFLAIGLGVAGGILVSVSRVVLHEHSMSEMIFGWALGSVTASGFIALAQTLVRPRRNPWILALSLAAMLPASHAEPAPTNRWITAAALYLSGHEQPYVRRTQPLQRCVSCLYLN